MLPLFLFMLAKKWMKRHPERAGALARVLFTRGRLFSFLIISLHFSNAAQAQQSQLAYSIYRNGKKVGSVHVQRSTDQQSVHYKLESNVKTRFIISFTATAMEESVFDNGRMVYSSIYRKLNGTEKVNRKTVLNNDQFLVTDYSTTESKKSFVVALNTLALYFQEPANVNSVYSDNFQNFLLINPKGQHAYAISLPDGTTNILSLSKRYLYPNRGPGQFVQRNG